MKVEVIRDADVLIPNPSHKNLTSSGQKIEANTILEGNAKKIKGLRKGKPFDYRVFITNKGIMTYLNNVKPIGKMRTEVTLGADAQPSETIIDVTSVDSKSNNKYIGAILGALTVYSYSKYKKIDNSKIIPYAIAGSVVGFAIGYYFDGGKSKINIEKSK